jgi:hypothetical protein
MHVWARIPCSEALLVTFIVCENFSSLCGKVCYGGEFERDYAQQNRQVLRVPKFPSSDVMGLTD